MRRAIEEPKRRAMIYAVADLLSACPHSPKRSARRRARPWRNEQNGLMVPPLPVSL
jgi:hypothetical protein